MQDLIYPRLPVATAATKILKQNITPHHKQKPETTGVFMQGILHVSNTRIDTDSRILKEISALNALSKVYVVGVPAGNFEHFDTSDNLRTRNLRLLSRSLIILPRPVRYFLELIEFSIKVVLFGYRIRPQVVHCHDTFALPSGWLLSKLINCKLVYDAHELESNKNGQSPLLSKGTLLIERACWTRVDLLISVSNSIVAWYIKNIGEKKNVVVLNSPALKPSNQSATITRSSNKYFHKLYNINTENPVFIYVGALTKGRGIEMCLDAFSIGAPNAHVVFLGDGILKSLVKAYSVKHSNIHLHAPVPHDAVVDLVRNANVGLCFVENVSLSDYYCLPNKLFEYCFSGVPVLASNFPEISRVVSDYKLGLCCEPDSQSIHKAIQLVTHNPLPAVECNMTELSWPVQAERLKHAYQPLLLAT